MNAQKAYHRFGVREEHVTIDPWMGGHGWAVNIPNEARPNGKQQLTSGGLFSCIAFKIDLRREHERVVARATIPEVGPRQGS